MRALLRTGVVLAVALSLGSAAQAGLMITNGDFETGAGENLDDVTGWFDLNTGNFWEGTWQTTASWITPNGSAVVVFSSFQSDDFGVPSPNPNDGGYLYQGIGTADGLASVEIGFDWGAPDDAGAGLELGMTVGVYAYDGVGGFVPADDTDVHGRGGTTLLDSESFTMTTTGVDGQVANAAATLDLSGAGSQELFLRFNNYHPGATEAWPIVDNVQIIPEPATITLLGLFGAGLLFVRRRFKI